MPFNVINFDLKGTVCIRGENRLVLTLFQNNSAPFKKDNNVFFASNSSSVKWNLH